MLFWQGKRKWRDLSRKEKTPPRGGVSFGASLAALDRNYAPLEACFNRVIARTLQAHVAP